MLKSVAAVILAAGESKRTGSPKLLFRMGEVTIIERVIRNFRDSNVKEVIVVLGAWKDEMLKITEGYGVVHCYNGNYTSGMLSSVICGIRALPPAVDAAIVMPGDYPFIGGSFLDEMTEAFLLSGKGLAIPVSGGRRGHPIIIDKKYFGVVEKLDPDRGLRELLRLYRDDVMEYQSDYEEIHIDIDTVEDYRNALNKIK